MRVKEQTMSKKRMQKTIAEMEEALGLFTATIINTGGLKRGRGYCYPAADDIEPGSRWVDLADAYIAACKALGCEPLIVDGEER